MSTLGGGRRSDRGTKTMKREKKVLSEKTEKTFSLEMRRSDLESTGGVCLWAGVAGQRTKRKHGIKGGSAIRLDARADVNWGGKTRTATKSKWMGERSWKEMGRTDGRTLEGGEIW